MSGTTTANSRAKYVAQGTVTTTTVTLALRAFASAIPCRAASSEASDPSTASRMFVNIGGALAVACEQTIGAVPHRSLILVNADGARTPRADQAQSFAAASPANSTMHVPAPAQGTQEGA